MLDGFGLGRPVLEMSAPEVPPLSLGDPFVVLLNAQADGGLPMMHRAFQLVSLVPYFGSAGGLLLLKSIFLPTLPRSCHCGGYLIGSLSLIPHSVQCL